jgi:hypothetical protein
VRSHKKRSRLGNAEGEHKVLWRPALASCTSLHPAQRPLAPGPDGRRRGLPPLPRGRSAVTDSSVLTQLPARGFSIVFSAGPQRTLDGADSRWAQAPSVSERLSPCGLPSARRGVHRRRHRHTWWPADPLAGPVRRPTHRRPAFWWPAPWQYPGRPRRHSRCHGRRSRGTRALSPRSSRSRPVRAPPRSRLRRPPALRRAGRSPAAGDRGGRDGRRSWARPDRRGRAGRPP